MSDTRVTRERRGYRGAVERLETRALLASAYNLLYGTVYLGKTTLGINSSGTADVGVQVQLYQSGDSTPIATTTTDANGQFSFAVSTAGTYTIKEVVPSGQTFSSSLASSQVFTASGSNTNALQVTVPSLTSIWDTYKGVVQSSYVGMNLQLGTETFQASVGLVTAALGTTEGATNLNAGFPTFCVDPLTTLSFSGGESFRVEPQPLSSLVSSLGTTVSADRAARIAYLVNTYAAEPLTNVEAAGVQLAIWELEEDTSATADFSTGNFQVLGAINASDASLVTQAEALAVSYFNQSANANSQAVLLNANALNNSTVPVGYQSMVATQTLEFDNVKTPPPPATSSLSGYVYCDVNDDGIREANEMGIGGVTMTLTGTDVDGKSVDLTVLTSSASNDAGYYSFPNLVAGTYTITEGTATGYTHLDQTQGTPGTGTAETRAFVNIKLAAGVAGQNNNFGEIMPPVNYSVVLSGIHYHPSVITLTLTGAVNPTDAANVDYYRVVGLNGPNTGPIPIVAATYNAATHQVVLTPAYHINIHHHYEITAIFPATDCTPTSIYSKIFGGYYHQVMIPVANPVILPADVSNKS